MDTTKDYESLDLSSTLSIGTAVGLVQFQQPRQDLNVKCPRSEESVHMVELGDSSWSSPAFYLITSMEEG